MSNDNPTTADTRDWPSLAVGLYDALTGRNAEITYDFENLNVSVPSRTSAGAAHAQWKVDGTLKVRTREVVSA